MPAALLRFPPGFDTAGLIFAIALSVVQAVWIAAAAVAIGRSELPHTLSSAAVTTLH